MERGDRADHSYNWILRLQTDVYLVLAIQMLIAISVAGVMNAQQTPSLKIEGKRA